MHISFATLLLLATTVSSQAIIQLLAQLPPCSIDCLTSGLADFGCTIRDVVCSCGHKAEITTAVTPCVNSTCSLSDGDLTRNITDQVCVLAESMFPSSFAALSTKTSSKTATPLIATSHPTTSLSTSTTAPLSPTFSSSLLPTTTSSPPIMRSSSLSTKAQIGIGVGAGIFGLLVIAALIFCIVGWRRRNRDLKHLAWINRRGTIKGRTELPGKEVRGGEGVVEMGEGRRSGIGPGIGAADAAGVNGIGGGGAEERSWTQTEERRHERLAAGDTETVSSADPGEGRLRPAASREDIVSPVSPMEGSFPPIGTPVTEERGGGHVGEAR